MTEPKTTFVNENTTKSSASTFWGDTYFGRVKARLRFFLISMIVVGPLLLNMCWEETLAAHRSNEWPSVEGEVLGVVAKNWQDDDGNLKYFGRAQYQYTVGDETYASDMTDFGPGTKRSDQRTALADVAQYRPGMKLPVYYDPADPSVAVLVKGVHPVRLAVFVGSIVMTIVGVVVLAISIRQWMSSRTSV